MLTAWLAGMIAERTEEHAVIFLSCRRSIDVGNTERERSDDWQNRHRTGEIRLVRYFLYPL